MKWIPRAIPCSVSPVTAAPPRDAAGPVQPETGISASAVPRQVRFRPFRGTLGNVRFPRPTPLPRCAIRVRLDESTPRYSPLFPRAAHGTISGRCAPLVFPIATETRMLHLVTVRHSPESCPGRPENEAVHPCLQTMDSMLDERGIRVVGRWADPAAHANFLVLDAENAHAIQEILMESGMFAHTSTEIRPVLSMD